ncbi:MAG: band 7 protein, partial [Planctomycetaceae bacterium]
MSQSNRSLRWLISPLIALVLLGYLGWEFFQWTVNRVFVPPGKSLLLRYKGPLLLGGRRLPEPGRLASFAKMEVGVMDEMVGPGRHFYCPLWWERTIVDDVIVAP